MIFVYPAAISDSVDLRYLPGLIKTMELYYLHHIAEAVAGGSIRFYVTQNRFTGSFSNIKMEAINWDYESLGSPETLVERADLLLNEVYEESKKIILEASIDDDPGVKAAKEKIELLKAQLEIANKELTSRESARDIQEKVVNDPDIDKERIAIEIDLLRDLRERVRETERKIEALQREIAKSTIELEKSIAQFDRSQNDKDRARIEKDKFEYEKEKERARETGGVTRMELDKNTLDLRPSAIVVEATVIQYEKTLITLPGMAKTKESKRAIPISVKIVPIKIKNVKDIYSVLTSDLYSNSFSSFFRSSVRTLASNLNSLFNPIIRIFLSTFTKPDDFGVYKDILFKKKSLVNASAIGSGPRFPAHQKYAASIIAFSVNDITKKDMNFLSDASKISKLHKMGWNSFAIMDDPDQILIFCSYFENGMCSKIPYSYLFASLKASDLFKELDSLSKFTSRVIGNFKARPTQVVEGLKFSVKLKEQNNNSFNKYLEIANKHGSK
jgi:hypothetical protein